MITIFDTSKSNPSLHKMHFPVSMLDNRIVQTLKNNDTEGYAKFVTHRGEERVEMILLDKGNGAFGIRRYADPANSQGFKTPEVKDALINLIDTNRSDLKTALDPDNDRNSAKDVPQSSSQYDPLGVAHFTAELLKDQEFRGEATFAHYDETRDTYLVGVMGKFDQMPSGIRAELIEANTLIQSDHGVDTLYYDADKIGGMDNISRIHDYQLSPEANGYLNDISRVNATMVADSIESEKNSFDQQMSTENTPEDYLRPDHDDHEYAMVEPSPLERLEELRYEIEAEEIVEAEYHDMSVEEYRTVYRDGVSLFDENLLMNGISPEEYWRENSNDNSSFVATELPDTDNAVNVTMTTPTHVLADASPEALDELHDTRILKDNQDGTSTIQVEVSDKGKIIEPYDVESTFQNKLGNEALSVVDQIHAEYKDGIQNSVTNFHKEQAAQSDAVSQTRVENHLHFLKQDTMNSKGWIKLDVPEEVASQYDERYLRDNGVNVSDGKMAMLVSLDDNGRPSLNSRAIEKGSFAEAFEQDMYAVNEKTIMSQAAAVHEQKEAAKFDRMQNSLGREGYDLSRNDSGKYVLTAKEEHYQRPDGVKSFMATPGNLKLENREFQNMSLVIAAAKNVQTQRADDQKAVHEQLGVKSFVVIDQKKLENATEVLKKNPNRVVEMTSITGDNVKLAYNKSQFELVAKSGGQSVTPVGDNSRQYLAEVKSALSEKGVYCRQDKYGSYEVGHVNEEKPRYSEKSVSLAAKSAYHMTHQVDAEREIQAATARQTSTQAITTTSY
ncbi:hypothetical protein [Brucella tritici]|uniref:Uncharacterized protein n=1 Tax=Brucella tritici TaxID=94626 RepID=A0A6L3Y8G8_9HYPH|nr:hypothetical protein [Brucella tritici]KAB2678063.1 hypothetical protein F9L08_24385 [Brucella tritici]